MKLTAPIRFFPPPCAAHPQPWSAPRMPDRKALEGITVIDIATLFAGPWIATYMADFGAATR